MTEGARRQTGSVGDEPELAASLEPVRRAVLADAAEEAERIVDAARTEAMTQIGAAQRRADQAEMEARQRARLTAAARADRATVAAQQAARAAMLQAESAIWEDLTERVHRAVAAMRSDERYPVLLDRLGDIASAQLGPGATVERDPPGGGVTARIGGRRVDYGLGALAERALDTIADEVSALWT